MSIKEIFYKVVEEIHRYSHQIKFSTSIRKTVMDKLITLVDDGMDYPLRGDDTVYGVIHTQHYKMNDLTISLLEPFKEGYEQIVLHLMNSTSCLIEFKALMVMISTWMT